MIRGLGRHPINLALRFLLEVAALTSMGMWGWQAGEGWSRVVFSALIPLGAAGLWGLFAVPDDPSRSGNAPIPVPGGFRLVLEGTVFAVGVWALYDLGHTSISVLVGVVVVLHYAVSFDRVLWLIDQ